MAHAKTYVAQLSPKQRIDCYEKMVQFFSGVAKKYPNWYNNSQLARFEGLLERELKKE